MSALATLVERLPDELRRRAFTHSSWVDERVQSYERLEFLGDCVLGLAVAEELYRRAPNVDEGRLAQQRAYVVSRPSCAIVARTLGLAGRRSSASASAAGPRPASSRAATCWRRSASP